MNKKLGIILIIISLLNLATNLFLDRAIAKHSVHPVYGTYQQKTFGCQPWDACKYPPDSLDIK